MDLRLAEKRVLVTGSSKGIGFATAKAFLSESATVVLNGRSTPSLADAKKALSTPDTYNHIFTFSGDCTQPGDIQAMYHFIKETLGGLDILVLNVGSGKPNTQNFLDRREWERILNFNLVGTVEVLHCFLDLLALGSSPSVVFVSSIAAREASKAPYAYAASKSALLSLSKHLSKDMAVKGIRVNCILPGNIIFPGGRWEELQTKDPIGTAQMLETTVPMRRFGTPEEIANTIVFIASPCSSFTTGATLAVDGGQLNLI